MKLPEDQGKRLHLQAQILRRQLNLLVYREPMEFEQKQEKTPYGGHNKPLALPINNYQICDGENLVSNMLPKKATCQTAYKRNALKEQYHLLGELDYK